MGKLSIEVADADVAIMIHVPLGYSNIEFARNFNLRSSVNAVSMMFGYNDVY